MTSEIMDPYEMVSQALQCDRETITEASGLGLHPKWDSFGHLRILIMMEQHYSITIDDASIRTYERMANVVARFEELANADR